jgi:hypothetical protein
MVKRKYFVYLVVTSIFLKALETWPSKVPSNSNFLSLKGKFSPAIDSKGKISISRMFWEYPWGVYI